MATEEQKQEQAIEHNYIIDKDIDIRDYDNLRSIIHLIEGRILSKLPDMLRLYELLKIINNYIQSHLTINGRQILADLHVEIHQLNEVFKFNTTYLEQIILKKDYKQINEFFKKKKHQESFIILSNNELTSIIKLLKVYYEQIITHTLIKNIDRCNTALLVRFKKINITLNYIKSVGCDVPYIIKPSNSGCSHKHFSHECAAGAFGFDSQTDYKDTFDIQSTIELHPKSRRYKCSIPTTSTKYFIDKYIPETYFRIINTSTIHLFLDCPCKKEDGSRCNKQFNFDLFIEKITLLPTYQQQLIARKKELFLKFYGIYIYTNCPTPDCANGNGMINKQLLQQIIDKETIVETSVCSCNLCNTIWCTKCNKIHPGQSCILEGEEEIDPSLQIKRCPQCRLPTERTEGCFHMQCSKCYIHWCFDCCVQISSSDPYSHKHIRGNWIETPAII